MWLGAEMGLRWGECAGITLGDIDLGAATIRVSLQLDRDQQLSPTNNKTTAAIDLSEVMVKELSEHLERHALPAPAPSTLIFSTAKRNRPLHYSNWRNGVWVPAGEQAGAAGFGFHELRRNNATILHDEGTVVKVAQERLRLNRSSTTLDAYTRATRRRHREAAEAVSKRIRGPLPSAEASADERAERSPQ